MRSHLWLLCVSGCFLSGGKSGPPEPPPPPPPVVDHMTPESAPYGADVAIYGSGFGDSGSLSTASVTSWSDTEIHLRVPFPAQPLAFEIVAPGGRAMTPVFTPTSTWAPGPSFDAPDVIVDARIAAASLVVLGATASTVAVIADDGTNVTTTPLPGITPSIDRRAPVLARLVDDGAGSFEVLANAGGTLQVFAIAGTQVTTFDTKAAGTLIAAGRDATGVFAWLAVTDAQNAPEVELVRPAASPTSAWQIVRGPIASPDVLDARVAADGTLVVAFGADASDVFDFMQKVAIEKLAPAATAFGAAESPDGIPWDDYIASAQLSLATDGARMVVAYSTQQNDETGDHPQAPDVRDALGTWQAADVVSPAIASGSFAYTTSGLATAASDDHGVTVVADVAKPTQTTSVPLWPASAAALVVDASGAPRPVIAIGTKWWFPAPPAP